MQPLGDDHALVLAFDHQVSQASDPAGNLSQHRHTHGVEELQVHECVFVVDRREGNHPDIVGNPVMPGVPVAELQKRVPIMFLNFRRLFRFLTLVQFAKDPQVK